MTPQSPATLPSVESAQPSERCRPSEYRLALWDGSELFYRVWLPEGPVERAVFLFHRGHEHSGRFCDVVPHLATPNTAFFAWDARGHGHTPGKRGWAPSFATIVKDIDFFIRKLTGEYGIPLANVIVLGHSVGAVAVAAWVHDYAPPIRRWCSCRRPSA